MKKTIFVYTLILIFSFLPNAFSADVAKIGVLSIQKVLDESSAGKMVKNQVETRNKEILKVLTDEKQQLDVMADELKKMSLLPVPMDKNKKEEKEKAFVNRRNKFFQMDKQLTKQMKQLNEGLMKKFYLAVNKVAQEIGKKEGYLLILEKREAGVFYTPSHIDITDSVTILLNQKTAAQAK